MEDNKLDIPDKFIFKTISDTLTGKKIHQITVKIRVPEEPKKVIIKPAEPIIVKRTFFDKLFFRPIPPLAYTEEIARYEDPELYRTFDIWPCVVRNQYRIAGNASMLVDGLSDSHSENIKFINENQPIVAYIVAAAIQNNKFEPEPELIQFIEDNFDGEDLYTALRACFDNLGMKAFSNSIVLLKGTVAILKPQTSPVDGSELIASHTATSDQYASILGGTPTL